MSQIRRFGSESRSIRLISLAPPKAFAQNKPMTHLAAKPETVKSLNEVFKRVKAGEHVVLNHRGRALGAFISVKDLQRLKRLTEAEEDRQDAEAANRVRANIKAGRDRMIPWEEAKKRIKKRKG